MGKNKDPEWYYCNDCDDWVGSIPPRTPYLWTNDKAAAAHRSGTGHIPQKITSDQLLPTPPPADPELLGDHLEGG